MLSSLDIMVENLKANFGVKNLKLYDHVEYVEPCLKSIQLLGMKTLKEIFEMSGFVIQWFCICSSVPDLDQW